MKKISARFVAVRLLNKWEEKDTYINISLNKFLEDKKWDDRNKHFLTEILNGVVKMKLHLDWIIDSFSHFTLQREIRNILRVALYQIIFMDNVPPFAAVSEAVNTAKRMGMYSSTRLINGILRGYLRNEDNIKFPTKKIPYLSVFYSHPEEMIKRYLNRFDEDVVIGILEANNETPPVALRVNNLKTTAQEMIETLKEKGIKAFQGEVVEEIIYVDRLKDVYKYVEEGLLTPQDESSAMVAKILSPIKGMRIWDMCAAPGGKTTHIAEITGDEAYILATDIYAKRLSLIEENKKRLGIKSIVIMDGDASQYKDKEGFDYILLDAPCSGTGVLRRKADLRWKFNEDNLNSLVKIQKELVDNAIRNLKDNGIFVYSTCSIEEEENEEILDYIKDKYPFMKIDLKGNFPYNTRKDAFFHLQISDSHDGGFAARLKKEVKE